MVVKPTVPPLELDAYRSPRGVLAPLATVQFDSRKLHIRLLAGRQTQVQDWHRVEQHEFHSISSVHRSTSSVSASFACCTGTGIEGSIVEHRNCIAAHIQSVVCFLVAALAVLRTHPVRVAPHQLVAAPLTCFGVDFGSKLDCAQPLSLSLWAVMATCSRQLYRTSSPTTQ